VADRQGGPDLEAVGEGVSCGSLLEFDAGHGVDEEAAFAGFGHQVAGGEAEVVLGGAVVLVVAGEASAHAAEHKDGSVAGPGLVGFDEAGEDLLVGLGLLARADDEAPGLLVEGGGGPAGGLEDRAQLRVSDGLVAIAVGAPAAGQGAQDGVGVVGLLVRVGHGRCSAKGRGTNEPLV
jgi:hypothetical protein